MDTTERGQPDDAKPDGRIDPDHRADSDVASSTTLEPEPEREPATPVVATDTAETTGGQEVLVEETTGTAEPLSSAIDGASRPDKVAIGLMVGVVVLLLICVAFGYAAR